MKKGVVKFWNEQKGFGFIKREGETDLFVHISGLVDVLELAEGDNVEYEIGEGRKGAIAVNVKKV